MALERLGLIKTSLVDFPGKVAATVFTYGCNLRCPYCHNANLVVGGTPEDFLDREDVLAFLRKRARVLDGVAVTGGEPLIHPDLPDFIAALREMRLQIKVDTNGLLPGRLESLDADYVAMDLKSAPARYDRLGPVGAVAATTSDRILRSLSILRNRRRDGRGNYELRTTVAPGVVTEEDFRIMAGLLQEGERIVLAPFRGGPTLDPAWSDSSPPSPEDMARYAAILGTSGATVVVREA
ncbi:MAG: anaerobic ribonucleoside-triphosphate reductase activating protein [Spirochaetota bacterium]